MIPFDTEIKFEELPLKIGSTTVALFNGTAGLTEDPGYGFTVSGISLDDHIWQEKDISIHAKHDDPFVVELFNRLSTAVLADVDIRERFEAALSDHLREVAA